MKLALLGHGISHSLSPSLYRELLGDKLESYELLDIEDSRLIPGLPSLAEKYDGLSITSPHKRHFFHDVVITSPIVNEIKAINTISFRKSGIYGTNTDVSAVEQILLRLKKEYGDLHMVVLGSGVMARVTLLVAKALQIPYEQYSRKKGDDVAQLDLSAKRASQTIVINCCARDFVFQGKLHPDLIFWDYNYAFLPHQTTLPSQVKSYMDGQEMLRLQAIAALEFWSDT
ncbi:MAG: shikimate dehydrogenase family protein [Bacteriovoracaceae bacterium]